VSRISAVDTSGVQLLLALLLEAPKRGLNLCLRGESAVLTKALQMLGLEGTMRAAHGHAGE
jgi:anti-anti-sigma regulatory factor